jgi:hypothetical protein
MIAGQPSSCRTKKEQKDEYSTQDHNSDCRFQIVLLPHTADIIRARNIFYARSSR